MILESKLHNKIIKIAKEINILIILMIFFSGTFSGFAKQNNPSFEDGVIYLSLIIAEEKYSTTYLTDLQIVDSLFSDALDFYEGDVSEALLALTFATLPFNKMPVTIPLVNIRIKLKLPSIDNGIFEKKRINTPGLIFFDSSSSRGEDRDKLAHFFGNAFLSYNFSFFNISKFFGLLVEMFEESFKVSGSIDFRDLQSNHLGEFFGYSLRNNPKLKVSDFLNVYSLFYFSYN